MASDATRLAGVLAAALPRIWQSGPKVAVAAMTAPMAEAMARYAIDTAVRAKHFLGQVGHESGQGRYRAEIASGAAYEGRRDLGNTHPGDGRRFKGRGLIQLTGRANYAEYSRSDLPRSLGLDLTAQPDLVATRMDLCCDVAGWFWHTRSLNELADRADWTEVETVRQITRKINGGFNGLNDRLALTAHARVVLAGAWQ
jgi:predicted chitinase